MEIGSDAPLTLPRLGWTCLSLGVWRPFWRWFPWRTEKIRLPRSEGPQSRRPSMADARGPEDLQSRARRQGRRLAHYHTQTADDGVDRQSPRRCVTTRRQLPACRPTCGLTYARHHYTCVFCGFDGRGFDAWMQLTVDHLRPRNSGGSDEPDNCPRTRGRKSSPKNAPGYARGGRRLISTG
jgi:5-methylcytosine-specific restriction endonuclease McrA